MHNQAQLYIVQSGFEKDTVYRTWLLGSCGLSFLSSSNLNMATNYPDEVIRNVLKVFPLQCWDSTLETILACNPGIPNLILFS